MTDVKIIDKGQEVFHKCLTTKALSARGGTKILGVLRTLSYYNALSVPKCP